MSEEKEPVPEGMKRYTMLGMDIVGPDGMPDEFVGSIFEAMVKSGAMLFDPDTGTIKPNPDMKPGEVGGLVMSLNDDLSVDEVRPLDKVEIEEDMKDNPEMRERFRKLLDKPDE